jgi:hypothetical protein
VAVMPCCNFSLLMIHIFGSSEGEWQWLVPCCNSSLLMMPVLGSPACEWLWYLPAIVAC